MNPIEQALQISSAIAADQGDFALPRIAEFWPALQKMGDEGAVVIVKIDGVRLADLHPKVYTVAVFGGKLGPENPFRLDSDSLDTAIAEAIMFYHDNVWSKEKK